MGTSAICLTQAAEGQFALFQFVYAAVYLVAVILEYYPFIHF